MTATDDELLNLIREAPFPLRAAMLEACLEIAREAEEEALEEEIDYGNPVG